MEKLKRTRIIIEVLSSIHDNPENYSIGEIARESYEGSWSMRIEDKDTTILEGRDAIKAECDKHGTSIEFFESELEDEID
jgi:hypothetical protein